MSVLAKLLSPDPALAALLDKRAPIIALTEASGKAVLTPEKPGGLSHGLRAAIAVRSAEAVGDEDLASHYRETLGWCEDWAEYAPLADLGVMPSEPRLAAILRHADRLALRPREATRGDIEGLKTAGVEEADIVRLSELAAFLGYQARLLAGLRLLKGR